MIMMTCLFLFGVCGREPKMSMATKSNGFGGGNNLSECFRL